MVNLSSVQFNTPGVYITETSYGAVPQGLSAHDAVYMLGYAGANEDTVGQAITVVSANDFYNTFGASYSTNSVKFFFKQRHGKALTFINVPVRTEVLVTITTVTTGQTYSVTIDGYLVDTVAVAGDSASTIRARLADKVNSLLSLVASIRGDKLRYVPGTVVTSSANVTLGTPSTHTYPVLNDVIDRMELIPAEASQGFIIAPEFFQQFSSQSDRQALANAIDAFCADTRHKWVGIVDVGQSVANSTTPGGAIAGVLAERNGMQSPNGHTALYFPYAVDESDNQVPLSAGVVGVALRRYQQEGYTEPPAGARFPLYGVKSFTVDITDVIQDQLNKKGVNCARTLPNGGGNVIWGARTLSTSSYFVYVTTRVILNVIEKTLQAAYRDFVFSTMDGLGALFSRVIGTANNILELVRLAGGLYGATASDAYLVVCDMTNNPAIMQEGGILNVDVFVKPSPLVEFINVGVRRTFIGEVFTEVAKGQTEPKSDNVPSDAGNSNGNTGG